MATHKFVYCPYVLRFQTLTHLNRLTNRGGNYKSFRRHVSSSTILYGSRDHKLLYDIEYMSEYKWPVEGFFVSPATYPEDQLRNGSEISTRVYNLIDPMSGVLNSAIFGSKGTTNINTKLSVNLKRILFDAIDAGFIDEKDVFKIKKNGERGTVDWGRTHDKPKEYMEKCRKAIFHILEVECPPTLASRDIDISAIYKVLHPEFTEGSLPGLWKIEEEAFQRLPSLSKDEQKLVGKLKIKDKPLSDYILDDLNLYFYAWDNYVSNHTPSGEVAIMYRGSNDPIPNYGTVEYINPGTEMNGVLICREEDVEKVRSRFSKLFSIGTFANTSEVSVFLGDFNEIDVERVEKCPVVTSQYPKSLIPEGLEIKEVVETTNRYMVVNGQYTGDAFKIGEKCIPYDPFFRTQFGEENGIKTDMVII